MALLGRDDEDFGPEKVDALGNLAWVSLPRRVLPLDRGQNAPALAGPKNSPIPNAGAQEIFDLRLPNHYIGRTRLSHEAFAN